MAIDLNTIQYKNKKIPVLFEKHKTLPIFNLQLVFKNSGYINDVNLSGLTSISSSMLNEGTLKDGAIKFSSKLEDNAIDIYVNSGLETFVIEVSCLEDQYTLALKFLHELLKNPNISENSLEKIKKRHISKLASKQNDFDYIASTNLKALIYKNTPLEHSNIGNEEDINKITLSNVQNKLSSALNINNLIIVAGGSISYEKLKQDLKLIFDELKDEKTNTFKKIEFSSKPNTSIIKKDTEQSYIYFASPFDISYDSKDNYKAKLASQILGASGFGSRLMEEIRVKNGLAYSVHATFINKKSYSSFSGYLQTKISNTNKAKDMVEKIVSKFVKNGVTQEELDATKKFLLGSEPLRTETFSQKLSNAFSLFYKDLPLDYNKQELDLIKNISLEELNTFIKKHNEIKNISFSIVTK